MSWDNGTRDRCLPYPSRTASDVHSCVCDVAWLLRHSVVCFCNTECGLVLNELKEATTGCVYGPGQVATYLLHALHEFHRAWMHTELLWVFGYTPVLDVCLCRNPPQSAEVSASEPVYWCSDYTIGSAHYLLLHVPATVIPLVCTVYLLPFPKLVRPTRPNFSSSR